MKCFSKLIKLFFLILPSYSKEILYTNLSSTLFPTTEIRQQLILNWTIWSDNKSNFLDDIGRFISTTNDQVGQGHTPLPSKNLSTTKSVKDIIHEYAGVYMNQTIISKYNLYNVVLVGVISISDDNTFDVYKQILQNWLCYTSHYGYKLLVYYIYENNGGVNTNERKLNSTIDNNRLHGAEFSDKRSMKQVVIIENLLNEFRSYNPNALFVKYPNKLFWKLLSKKTRWMGNIGDRGYVDFRGDKITFSHFGALVMLVPLLEILELGYDVIYMDTDIALVKDPIPFINLGDATINVSPEIRKKCTYFTYSRLTKKEVIEWHK